MKERMWLWIKKRSTAREGEVMPVYMMAVRWMLFPLQSTRWWLNKGEGYDPCSDTWTIAGCRWSNQFFIEMANPPSDWFRSCGAVKDKYIQFEVWRK